MSRHYARHIRPVPFICINSECNTNLKFFRRLIKKVHVIVQCQGCLVATVLYLDICKAVLFECLAAKHMHFLISFRNGKFNVQGSFWRMGPTTCDASVKLEEKKHNGKVLEEKGEGEIRALDCLEIWVAEGERSPFGKETCETSSSVFYGGG
jgi:hypothetical protein